MLVLALLCGQTGLPTIKTVYAMNEFVIISKDVFEEMVGKFNRFSDRVNEILGKREEGRLSRWMDNQDVCQLSLIHI